MSVLISFILPCYNVDRYIRESLESIYSQGVQENDFEVICVNDCSTDNTKVVIEEFGRGHRNLILINHFQNKTAGGARNTGIDVAKGEYIWFVDPDDMIRPHSAYSLYLKAKEADADIDIICTSRNVKRLFVDKTTGTAARAATLGFRSTAAATAANKQDVNLA